MQIDNCPLVLRSSWRNEKGDDYKKKFSLLYNDPKNIVRNSDRCSF